MTSVHEPTEWHWRYNGDHMHRCNCAIGHNHDLTDLVPAPQPAAHRAGEVPCPCKGCYADPSGNSCQLKPHVLAQPPAAGEVEAVLENLGRALYVDGYQDKLIDPLYAEALQAIEAHYDARFEAAHKQKPVIASDRSQLRNYATGWNHSINEAKAVWYDRGSK